MSMEARNNEAQLRSRFDFDHAERGSFARRYKKGTRVTVLEGTSETDDPLEASQGDSQLVEIAGKHLLISRLVAAGYEVAEPIRDRGIDLIVYRDGHEFSARPVQMKASTHESFSLDKKYEKFKGILIAYVWNVNVPEQSDVFVLTFDQARGILETKGYAKSNSWAKNGYYFVRNAGSELKALLEPYRMSSELWQQKLPSLG